ncbi:lmo0937 family membrane protein [Tessaracoccus sp. OS52]|uniref:lmo0937 family membrane protein n=1 Tax=Tessaracoccus sp. OS52 TaxID=2886691 RepID=UPI001D107D5F|nr:lmo0937 family membrane protein [Tessaracoccus sp. OS52]MCC2593369.1 lmo0937 family membrane protein [Tessaracoccus sp. OS52]
MARILWIVLAVVIVLWLLGLLTSVGGNLIHLLLVVALVILVINLISGRRAV